MTIITIPKEIIKNKDLVAVPKNIYKDFLAWQKKMRSVKTFVPTASEKKTLRNARKNFKTGNYLTVNELRSKLGLNR